MSHGLVLRKTSGHKKTLAWTEYAQFTFHQYVVFHAESFILQSLQFPFNALTSTSL